MGQFDFRQIVVCDVTQTAIHGIIQARLAHHICGQVIGQDIAIADCGPTFFWAACHLIQTIGNVAAVNDRFV